MAFHSTYLCYVRRLTLTSDPLILAYLAGLFDGEGSVSMLKSKGRNGRYYFKIALQLSMCNKELVEYVQENLGGWFYLQQRKTTSGHIAYHGSTQGPNSEIVLQSLIPFLREKKEVAQIALDYFRQAKHPGRQLSSDDLKLREETREQIMGINAAS